MPHREASPALLPLPLGDGILARIQTESLCPRCAYVLRSQSVWRDTATALLVARCPECGTVHPPRDLVPRTTLWRRWLARRHTKSWPGLIAWILITYGLCWLTTRIAAVLLAEELSPFLAAAGVGCIVLGAAMLICCAYMYRLGFIFRVAVLAAPPLLVLLQTVLDDEAKATAASAMCSIHIALALIIALVCRAALRGFVRACCNNACRGVFAGLWEVDHRALDLAPW